MASARWRCLRQCLPLEARLERRDQVGRRSSSLDLDALDVLPCDLLFDRLQQPLPVLVLVVIGTELGRGELTNQPLGERPLLVADLWIPPLPGALRKAADSTRFRPLDRAVRRRT
jgi:hypothetical protein